MQKCRKMKKPPVFPKDKNGNCHAIGYDDLRSGFPKIVEEGRNQRELSLPNSDSFKKKVGMKERKNKTWKRSLSSWFKFQKKKAAEEAPPTTKFSKGSNPLDTERSLFSGPLFGNSRRFGMVQQHNRLVAPGPLACCFTPTRAEETEVPYMHLDNRNNPMGTQAFGPVYLVT
ncbi:hypothetical protein MUK42_27276 [Musa troglodytarum]|uniref:Uncharacterized protein n=2 Tax=Musa troglodytarum TaxID=320322 RepID=A0A9E7F451_9LILI|nr:hypothetical protein MUK42_27276 [Musa troglodytarum]